LSHAHGTVQTLMTRAGVAPDHAERAMGVFDHAYYQEKRRAFEAVAARIRLILKPRIEW
jgi:hypothetical protein